MDPMGVATDMMVKKIQPHFEDKLIFRGKTGG